MKLNISYPASGSQKGIEIDDDKKIRQFFDKQISQEVSGDILGDQWKGYIFKIMGGNDKQGFPMMQGVLTNTRVRLLLSAGHQCFRARRDGARRRKSVRGCVIGPDIAALHLVIVKKGPEDIPGLTDKNIPNRLGPKRASKIRRLFNLSKKDDVRKYVIRRTIPAKEAKEGKKATKAKSKAPKIQRLVTPRTLRHKREIMADKRHRRLHAKELAAEYAKLVAQRAKDERSSKRSRRSSSKKEDEAPKVGTTKATDTKPSARKEAKPTTTKQETKTATTKPTTTTATKPSTDTKSKTRKPTDTKTTTAKKETKPAAAPAKKETKTAAPAKDTKKQPVKQETKPAATKPAPKQETKPAAPKQETKTAAPKETKPATPKETKPATPKETKPAAAPKQETKPAAAPKQEQPKTTAPPKTTEKKQPPKKK